MNKYVWFIMIVLFWSSCTYDHFNETVSKCAGTTISLAISVSNVSSCGASDGSLTIGAAGGTRAYTYSVNGGTFQHDSSYKNLKAGSYTLTVKDANGCTATQLTSINSGQTSLTFTVATTSSSGCATADGTITITESGGQTPIQYKLNSGAFQTSNVFGGLTAGAYSVSVVDASGCPVTGAATVASSGPSFKTDVNPIIASNCATGGCHNGSRNPNLSTYSGISANASSIVGAINSNMPPGGKLSSSDIATITCWVKAGALNN